MSDMNVDDKDLKKPEETKDNDAKLREVAQKKNPNEVKVTVENAPLVIVALLTEIRDQNKKILSFYEKAGVNG